MSDHAKIRLHRYDAAEYLLMRDGRLIKSPPIGEMTVAFGSIWMAKQCVSFATALQVRTAQIDTWYIEDITGMYVSEIKEILAGHVEVFSLDELMGVARAIGVDITIDDTGSGVRL